MTIGLPARDKTTVHYCHSKEMQINRALLKAKMLIWLKDLSFTADKRVWMQILNS